MINLSTVRVLIVDDVQTVQKMLTKHLNELGIRDVQLSDSPDESWNMLVNDYSAGRAIDLVFCDWHMPKGDGLNLLEQIRSEANPDLRLTKFIMMTGANEKTLISMDKGANNIIHKPFTLETVKIKLELVLGRFTSN